MRYKHLMTKLAYAIGGGTIGLALYFWGKSQAPAVPVLIPTNHSNEVIRKPNGSVPFDPAQIRPQDFFKYGFPGPVHDLQTRSEFVSCYDRSTRNPYYVVEHITKESLQRQEGVDRKKLVFTEDEQIPMKFRARLRDFFRSGYDRGHNAPAANAKFNQLAMDETFYLTNMSPQVGEGFNRDYWAHFEDFSRKLTSKYDNVRIMTGPLYLPKLHEDGKYRVTYEVIGSPPNIAVPTHFFKLIIGENNGQDSIAAAAFVMPNDKMNNNEPLTNFQVPIEAVERASGLELLQKIAPNKKRDLCKETRCQIVVREFPKQVNNLIEGKK